MDEEALQAVEDLSRRLEGRTIVRAGLDVNQDGFHMELDDGRVFIVVGLLGLYQPVEQTLQ